MIYQHPPRLKDRPSWRVTVVEILLAVAIMLMVLGGMLIGKTATG